MIATGPDPARSDAANLLVIAPPGCGKTQLLARRAAYLIPQLRPNQRILALTFSNKARENLAERIRSVVGRQVFRRYIRMRNFHGHATELLRAHGATIGLDPNFTQPTIRALDQPVRARFAGLPVAAAADRRKAMEAALGQAKQRPLDDQQVMDALISTGNADAVAVEAAWRQAGLLSYADLLRHVQRLLQLDAVANLYQHHYGAVLVDEFQDLSPQQLDITLRTVTACRTFVGDPLQGIYTWAGARPVEVETQLRKLCGSPLSLTQSYRSSPAVLAVVNAASAPMGGLALSAAEPARWPDGGAAVAVTFPAGIEEGRWITEQCAAIMARDSEASIGVIARAGWRRRVIDSAFASSDVPFTRWDLAIDNPAVVDILRAAWRRLPARSSVDALENTALSGLATGDSDTFNDVVDAITALRDMAADAGSVTRALAQLRIRERTEAAAGPGVHVLNAHTGKGQQFDWVFIPGVEDFHMPSGLAHTAAELAEEHRVLLVMLSRARHAVILSRAQSLISNAGNRYNTKESVYWQPLAAVCTMPRNLLEAHIARYQRLA
jgi:DNA helicase-2/ATP-dependent DNA helicase PcrA